MNVLDPIGCMKITNKIQIFSIILGAFTISLLINIFDFHYLEFLTYDVRFRARPITFRSPHLQIINLKPSTIEAFRGTPNLKDHILVLENLLKQEPRAIFYMIDPVQIEGTDQEKKQFSDILKKFKSFYIYTFKIPKHGEENILELDGFDLRYSVAALSYDFQHFAEDRVARRAVLKSLGYVYAQVDAARLINPVELSGYRGSFDFEIPGLVDADAYQIYVNYQPSGTYEAMPFEDVYKNQISNSVTNKIVILGSENGHTADSFLKTVFNRKNFAMNFAEANANVIATLIHNNGIIKTGRITNFVFTAIFAIAVALGIFWYDPKKGLLFVVGSIAAVCFISWSLFVFGGIAIGTIYPLLTIFIIYYLLIPYRLIEENKKNYEVRRTLEHMRISAKSAKVDLGFRIASQVAHDLKSPVMALMTIRSVSQSHLKPEVLDLLGRTIKKIDFIGDTLLKKFTKKTSEFENEQAPQDLIQVVQEAIDNQLSIFKNSKIQFLHSEKTAYLNFNKIEIDRAVNNLLINAIEAANGNAEIKISIENRDKIVVIRIEDKGAGIPSDVQGKIFESGFTFGKETGTGIGLAQAKDAFVREGGDLRLVLSKSGQTIFEGGLPVGSEIHAEIAATKNILLIEDVPETQLLWRTVLTKNGFNFLICQSYRQFEEQFVQCQGNFFNGQRFTLITDLIFDGEEQGGFDVIHRLRDANIKALARVYICTSLATNSEILKAAKSYHSEVFGKKDIFRLKFNLID